MSELSPSGQMNVTLVYDGDCPICQRFADYITLRSHTALHLIDARQDSPVVAALWDQGINLHQTFALQIDEQLYVGADAVGALNALHDGKGMSRWLLKLFRWPWLGRRLYPLLVRVRLFLLKRKGIAPLVRKN